MADYYWPVQLIPSESEVKLLDSTARSESPLDGFVRTMIRPGQKIRLRLSFNKLRDSDRKLGMAAIAALRGASGRLIIHDHTHVLSGVFPATEKGPSPTMLSIAGYTAGSSFDATQIGRLMRLKRSQNTGGAAEIVRFTSAATVTAHMPYVGRIMAHGVRGAMTGLALNLGSSAFGSEFSTLTGQEPGLLKLMAVPTGTSLHFSLTQATGNSSIVGDVLDIPFMSLSQCALVDNGCNVIPFSIDLSNAAWNQGAGMTVHSTSVVLPDGSSGTVNTLREDNSAATTHFLGDNCSLVDISSMSGWWCFGVAVKQANRNWVQLRIQDVSASANVRASFNVATGVVGTIAADSPTWEDQWSTIASIGDGWHVCYVLARCTTGNTNIGPRILIGEGDNDVTFTGLTQNSLYAYRPTLSPSKVPMRLVGTSGTAFEEGNSQDLGSKLFTKGWPASTANLAAAGDIIEIGGRKCWSHAQVDSDAAGLCRFLSAPVQRIAPADNEPVILNQPHGKYFLLPVDPGWLTAPPGYQTELELELMEAA